MKTFLLRERVLSDDTLCVADDGKAFKGGYIAIVKEHSFASAWSDRQEVKKFRKKDRALTYLRKRYTEEELEFVEL